MHGVFEVQQGSSATPGIFINAKGGDCQPSCFPAMTILGNYSYARVAATLVGLILLVWAIARTGKPGGEVGLAILSLILLLVGGGYLPPILGIVAAVLSRYVKRSAVVSGTKT
ncbi:MAG: hypothetical protein HYW93_07275 [Thaumarchaeota archaeon]|nr:hypothetical protein [Nitrososphaerota archaeon]